MFHFLAGSKTYILGLILILDALARALGWYEGQEPQGIAGALPEGLAGGVVLALRAAISKIPDMIKLAGGLKAVPYLLVPFMALSLGCASIGTSLPVTGDVKVCLTDKAWLADQLPELVAKYVPDFLVDAVTCPVDFHLVPKDPPSTPPSS